MSKKATTVEEQIELLKSRGITISNEEKAKEHLLDIGYYRLGFYWHYYQCDAVHNFEEGTDIKDAIDLYYLDVDLKNLLARYIYRIEVHFRTQLIYYVSNKYKDNPIWFSDKSIVRDFDKKVFNLKIYNKLKEENIHISKHHKSYPKHKYAPAWKTLEFLTFGQVLHFYEKIKDEDVKNIIAGVYGIRDMGNLKSYLILHRYLVQILNIRNICSHSGVLFDYKQPTGVRTIPIKEYRVCARSQTNLNASVSLVLFMLSVISKNRANDLEKKVKEALEKAVIKNEKLKIVILNHMGFQFSK